MTVPSVPADAPVLTCAAMRAAEAAMVQQGVSLSELMERAGAAVADIVWRAAAGRSIVILCGPGNNGGDGYVAARLLSEYGAKVRVGVAAPPTTDLAKAARQRWNGALEEINADLLPAPLLVDALFGVGLTRPLASRLQAQFHRLAERANRIIAVDLPSGLGSDDAGLLSPPPRADISIAVGALKPSHVLLPAAQYCGRVILRDLGIKTDSTVATLAPLRARSPAPDSHKYTRGQVMVVAGEMAGAAQLAAAAALRAGAGHVLLSPARQAFLQAIVCAPTDPQAKDFTSAKLKAIVLGSGAAASTDLMKKTAWAVDSGKAVVCDAAAIGAFLDNQNHQRTAPRESFPSDSSNGECRVVLTPHAGEFARYFARDIAHDFARTGGSKIEQTLAAAKKTGAVVLHKGADTIIAAPDGRVRAAWPGNPHLATAGSGDVLAGVCGAMLAQGLEAFEAGCAAVAWHIAQAHRVASSTAGIASSTAGSSTVAPAASARAASIVPALIADDLVRHSRNAGFRV